MSLVECTIVHVCERHESPNLIVARASWSTSWQTLLRLMLWLYTTCTPIPITHTQYFVTLGVSVQVLSTVPVMFSYKVGAKVMVWSCILVLWHLCCNRPNLRTLWTSVNCWMTTLHALWQSIQLGLWDWEHCPCRWVGMFSMYMYTLHLVCAGVWELHCECMLLHSGRSLGCLRVQEDPTYSH